MQLAVIDVTNNNYQRYTKSFTATGAWERQSITFIATTGTSELSLIISGPRGSSAFNIDGAQLEQGRLTEWGYPIVEVYYTHRDHLGSSSVVTDFKGVVRRWYANRPYGEEWRISAEALTDFEYGDTPEERGWSVYDPAGTLSIVYDPERKGRVLKLSTTEGTGFGVTYSGGLARFTDMRLGEEGLRVAVKAQGSFVFYVRVADTMGKQWYLTYKPEDGSPVLSGEYYIIKLGASYADGSWRTIERNLREDLLAGTGAVFDHVVWVCVRGDLCLDDLWFHSAGQVLPPRDVDEHRFTGKEMDRGTGLVYFGARYYDPEVGRFTTPDPAQHGLNWYAYCNNNPLIYIDITGKAPYNIQKEGFVILPVICIVGDYGSSLALPILTCVRVDC